MFNWLRSKPAMADVAEILSALCVVNEQILAEAVRREWFEQDDANHVVDTLPGAMHALTASLLGFDSPRDRERLYELLLLSESAIQAKLSNPKNRMRLAMEEYSVNTAVGLLERRDEADQREVRNPDRHFWLWNDFIQRAIVSEPAELSGPESKSLSRMLLVSRMGMEVSAAVKSPRKHPLFGADFSQN